jgi:glycosyltransferase involved in cell wall biosynthesis
MKILVLTEFFSPRGKQFFGGVETRCYYLKKYSKEFGFETTIYSRPAVKWNFFNIWSVLSGFLYVLDALKFGLNSDFDVVEGTNFTTYFVSWLIGRLKGRRVVYWYADVFVGTWVKNFGILGILGEIIERFALLFKADCYLCISAAVSKKLVEHSVPEERVVIIPCGVDFDEVKRVKARKHRVTYDIICVSRLVAYKRVKDLVLAAAILKREIGEIKIAVIGDGPEKHRLKILCSQLDLDSNILFLGHLKSHLEVLSKIHSSRVLCHPSAVEGFGIAIVEGASFGKPYVACDIPAVTEITLNGTGGMLVEPENSLALAKKLGELLFSTKIYKQKSIDSEKLSRRYSWKTLIEKTCLVYKTL